MASNKDKTQGAAGYIPVSDDNAKPQSQAVTQPEPQSAELMPAPQIQEILPDRTLSEKAKEILDKEPRVQVKIPKLSGGDKRKQTSVIVGVNTYMYSIPRGILVMVPQSVKEAIDNADIEQYT